MTTGTHWLKRRLQPTVEFFRRTVLRGALRSDAIVRKRMNLHSDALYIHPTNTCNARCVFCSYKVNPERKVVSSMDVFKTAIDQWIELVPPERVFLDVSSNNGEPLIDPMLVEKLAYAKGKGIATIWFSSNGILLERPGLAEELVKYSDSIGISIPGFNREDYKRVFGVDKAEHVLRGVIALAEAKRAANSPVKIALMLRIDRPLEEVMQDEGMRQLAPYLEDGTLHIPEEQIRGDNMFTWGNVITDEQLPGDMKIKPAEEFDPDRRPCRNIFNDVSILTDGKVRVCSCQYMNTNYDELVIGDIQTHHLREILLGETHTALMRDQAEGRWAPVCRNCSIYQPIQFSHGEYLSMAADVLVERAKSLLPNKIL